MAEIVNVALCADCVYADANGWDERVTGLPVPVPAPLGLLPVGALLGPDAGEDGDGFFSWNRCDGCGCTLGGQRFDYVAVFPEL